MAARHMTASQRYRCPPGTGIPKELIAMFIARNSAVTVILFVVIVFMAANLSQKKMIVNTVFFDKNL